MLCDTRTVRAGSWGTLALQRVGSGGSLKERWGLSLDPTRAAMRACRSRGELAGGLLCPAAPAAIISLQSKWMEVWLRKGRGLMAAGET